MMISAIPGPARERYSNMETQDGFSTTVTQQCLPSPTALKFVLLYAVLIIALNPSADNVGMEILPRRFRPRERHRAIRGSSLH